MGVSVQELVFDANTRQAIGEIQRLEAAEASAKRELVDYSKAAKLGSAEATKAWQDQYVKLYAIQMQLKKAREEVGKLTQSTVGMSRQMTTAFGQIGYMVQDVSATIGTMGIAGAVKSIGDNAVFVAAQFGGWPALFTSLGVVAGTVLGGIFSHTGKVADKAKEVKDILKELNAEAARMSMAETDAGDTEKLRKLEEQRNRVAQAVEAAQTAQKQEGFTGLERAQEESAMAGLRALKSGDVIGAGASAMALIYRGTLGMGLEGMYQAAWAGDRDKQAAEAVSKGKTWLKQSEADIKTIRGGMEARKFVSPMQSQLREALQREIATGKTPEQATQSIMDTLGKQVPAGLEGGVKTQIKGMARAEAQERVGRNAAKALDPLGLERERLEAQKAATQTALDERRETLARMQFAAAAPGSHGRHGGREISQRERDAMRPVEEAILQLKQTMDSVNQSLKRNATQRNAQN